MLRNSLAGVDAARRAELVEWAESTWESGEKDEVMAHQVSPDRMSLAAEAAVGQNASGISGTWGRVGVIEGVGVLSAVPSPNSLSSVAANPFTRNLTDPSNRVSSAENAQSSQGYDWAQNARGGKRRANSGGSVAAIDLSAHSHGATQLSQQVSPHHQYSPHHRVPSPQMRLLSPQHPLQSRLLSPQLPPQRRLLSPQLSPQPRLLSPQHNSMLSPHHSPHRSPHLSPNHSPHRSPHPSPHRSPHLSPQPRLLSPQRSPQPRLLSPQLSPQPRLPPNIPFQPLHRLLSPQHSGADPRERAIRRTISMPEADFDAALPFPRAHGASAEGAAFAPGSRNALGAAGLLPRLRSPQLATGVRGVMLRAIEGHKRGASADIVETAQRALRKSRWAGGGPGREGRWGPMSAREWRPGMEVKGFNGAGMGAAESGGDEEGRGVGGRGGVMGEEAAGGSSNDSIKIMVQPAEWAGEAEGDRARKGQWRKGGQGGQVIGRAVEQARRWQVNL
ncbi:unnamed protein product [Closterium sp. NIES-65]|nr:unnamed protein product [Closterium sp. NIES-65]